MNQPFTAISLFSGAVDGLAIAAQAAGFKVTHHVEWDAWCCRVLRMNHPHSIVINADIKTVKGLPYADIVFGGPPCQDFSTAGKRAGFAGERYLWPEMRRIVGECRPRCVIFENVRGAVSAGLLDRVCTDLELDGYEAWPLVYPVEVFGAPHERYRLFIIGLMPHTDQQRQHQPRTQQESDHDINGFDTSSKQGRRTEFHASEPSSETVGDSASIRREGRLQDNPSRLEQSGTSELDQGSNPMVNPTSQHHEDIGTSARNSHVESEPAGSDRSVGKFAIDDRTEMVTVPNEERSLPQPGLGSVAAGHSTEIHRLNPVTEFPGWPAGQGIYQHAYEPARTTPKAGKWAKERIEAHGNAVVWQQAAPVMRTMMRWLKGERE